MCMRPRRRATGTELRPKPSLQYLCTRSATLLLFRTGYLLWDADADSIDLLHRAQPTQ